MEKIKVFEGKIDIEDSKILFNSALNIDNYILNKIKDKYEKKCFKMCYINKVNKIIKRSDISFYINNLNGLMYIDVQFEVNILQYEMYDIINNIKVIDIDEKKIICKNDFIDIYIQNNPNLNTIQINQIIPIKVGICKYTPNQISISINAFPFVPIKIEEQYYKITNLSELDKNLLKNGIMKDILKEEEIKKNILIEKNNRWEYFNNMIYPYKIEKDDINNKLKYDLLSLKCDNCIVSMSQKINLSNHILLQSKIETKEMINIINEKAINVYYIYLNNYLKYLKNINELCEIYKTDKMFDSHINIFDIYIKHKL